MQTVIYKSKCPFEIGDRIQEREIGRVHEITDIATINYLKSGKVKFLYELNGSGKYVSLDLGQSGLREYFSSTVCREDKP